MKEFLSRDFLLDGEAARRLYYEHAEKMPIFDFHCHLSPKEIYEDKTYRSLTEVWLGGDHYKWRLMREAGVAEELVTGDAPDREKFKAYAAVMPYAIGNPIYAWTHLELRRFFGIDQILSPETADEIYDEANEKLRTLTARKMILMSNVRALCTTDDPVDSLEYHALLAQDRSFPVEVHPSFRPDKAIKIEQESFLPWLGELSRVVGEKIDTYKKLIGALTLRAYYFDEVGCVCADHGLDGGVEYLPATEEECERIFAKALQGAPITAEERRKYKGAILVALGKIYHKLGWAQQYHIGALRNNSARNFRALGPDTGFDAMDDRSYAADLSGLLSALDETDELPKTILYPLNPRDQEMLAALMNCFQGGIPGKIQLGSGWWFNDQKDGMQRQMEALMQVGLISRFVGMLTDSRSFTSYPRHEYFRRILCSKLGALLENGEFPYDLDFVGKIVEDICYNNAAAYFKKS